MAEILNLFPALSGMMSLPKIVCEDDPKTTEVNCAISDLTDFLDRSVEGASTGFAVQELVEGLAQLAVHPINKEKIIEKSLSSFYKILEKSNDRRLTSYVREVLDRLGFSDVCPTGTEHCHRDTEKQNKGDLHPDEQKESADIMLMLDDLQCVLLDRESFCTNDVVDIISGVRQMVYGNLNCRQNIFQHMTKKEWPDLFVRIISDVWSLGEDVGLYTNEVSWSILENAITMLTTYSDADVDFADALIEHGALKLVFKIAAVYYIHLLEKATALQEKVAEYRGEAMQWNKKPEANEQKVTHAEDDLLKLKTTEDSVRNSSYSDKPDPGSTPTTENATTREVLTIV
ncbi:uncharacterized protein LOC117118221 [Anneissia japonica]|uniref:uncharacterized protein LOC117118221 n=1 Tax=Anneissia japonica TaxID=1529436 RepID=UPI001425B254|nr:uncharacterized protein LOC117118221 [Anneissia japonica]